MKVLQGQFSDVIRLMPLIMKFKIGLINRVLARKVNSTFFDSRFDYILERFQFENKFTAYEKF
jgi:hypothetical protein